MNEKTLKYLPRFFFLFERYQQQQQQQFAPPAPSSTTTGAPVPIYSNQSNASSTPKKNSNATVSRHLMFSPTSSAANPLGTSIKAPPPPTFSRPSAVIYQNLVQASQRPSIALPAPSTPAAKILNSSGDNIKVYLRIRPLTDAEKNIHGDQTYIKKTSESSIAVKESASSSSSSSSSRMASSKDDKYYFDQVFDTECGQQKIFEETTQPLIKGLFSGNSSLLFAYGVTNAGKTYTIQGNESEEGILPRILDSIFDNISRLKVLNKSREIARPE